MDIVQYNREAWNKQAKEGCRWCEPVSAEEIKEARAGNWSVILTPNTPVPRNWFGDVEQMRVLCLASGGGQQAPILAAAGAKVTSFDNSDEQLALDQSVADREGLTIETIQGDMADLSVFENESFDLIFHPVSNVFVQSLAPVWKECFRVLRWNGSLLSGFMNPSFFLFDHEEAEKSGTLEVRYGIPFSDLTSLPEEKRAEIESEGTSYEFGHTLQEQIGGQLAAGFVLIDLFEDHWEDEATPLNRFSPTTIATLAKKIRLNSPYR